MFVIYITCILDVCNIYYMYIILLLLLFVIFRGFSRKLHKLVSEHRHGLDHGHHSTITKRHEKFEARNWKKLSEREILKLHPVQRSKFMMVIVLP